MMVFVDTSALYALVDADDPQHLHAVEALQRLRGIADLVTHNYVVVEAISLVRRRLGASHELQLIDDILPIMRTIWIDEAAHRAGAAAYRAGGRSGSLVDSVSFEVMRRSGIDTAFAYDADFEREGFRSPPAWFGPRPDARLSETPAPYVSASEGETRLVSVSEIAARSGRSTNTIQSWRRRHADFPAPNVELATGPIWIWSDVSAWIERRSLRTASTATR